MSASNKEKNKDYFIHIIISETTKCLTGGNVLSYFSPKSSSSAEHYPQSLMFNNGANVYSELIWSFGIYRAT